MSGEIDFSVENHGSVVVFHALTEAARNELEVMGLEDWQFVGEDSFAVDRRLAGDLAEALNANGLLAVPPSLA
jgi:hypothetical protein